MSESFSTIPAEPREVIREGELGNYTDLCRPLTLWPKLEAMSQESDSPIPLVVRDKGERLMVVRGASIYAHNIITKATPRPKSLSDRILNTIIDVGYRHDSEVDELFVRHSPATVDIPLLDRPAVSLGDIQRFSQSIFGNRQGAQWLGSYLRSQALKGVELAWQLGSRDIVTGGIALRAHGDSYGFEAGKDPHFTNYTSVGITVDRVKHIHETTPSKIPAQRYVLGNYLKLVAASGVLFEAPEPYAKPPVIFDESYKPTPYGESGHQLPSVAWAAGGLAQEVALFAKREKYYPASAIFCDETDTGAGVIPARVNALLDDIFRRKTLTPEQAGISDLKLKMLCAFDAMQQPLSRELAHTVTAKRPAELISLPEIMGLARTLSVPCDIDRIMQALQATDHKRHKGIYSTFDVGFLQERFEGVLLSEELRPSDAYVLSRYLQALRCAADTVNRALGEA